MLQGMGKSGVGSGYAIQTSSDNNLIEYNEIRNTSYIGIRFGGNHTVVKNNFIDTFCTTKDDGAGIYTWTGSSNQEFVGRKVTGNIVINGIGAHEGTPSTASQAEGIYLDDNSSGVEVAGNTVHNVSSKGIYVHNARNIVVRDNRFVNNGTQLHMNHDNLGDPIRNAVVTGNVFFASKASQLTSYVGSIKDDLNQMGSMDHNYYARPVDDVLTIMTQKTTSAGRISNNYDLEGWKKSSGRDLASRRSPMAIPTFKIVNLDPTNKYPHGSYSTSGTVTTGIHGSNSTLSWNSGGKLDQGALQVKGNGNSSVTIKAGSVKKSKHYVLRFSALASKNAIMKVLLLQSNSPYAALGEKVTVEIKTGRTEHEVVFPMANDELASSMRFESTDSDLTYWLDNVSLHEADAEAINPEDYIRFEYNPTKTDKSIPLDGTYVDMKNTTYSGTLFQTKV
jgi:parallel beta-helix repeat protein